MVIHAMHRTNEHGIATVRIVGTLEPRITQGLIASLTPLATNEFVQSVAIEIDSSGGSGEFCRQLFEAIRELDRTKPVAARVVGSCCNEAFWVATACRKITLENADCEIGFDVHQCCNEGFSRKHMLEDIGSRRPGILVSTGIKVGADAVKHKLCDEEVL